VALSQMKVLIVDDSPLVCSIAREAIGKHSDYECQSVLSAEVAMDMIHEYQPNLLVVDVDLPGIDGYEFVHHLREGRRWEAVPVILLTEKNTSECMTRAYNCGADDLLIKPFDPLALVLKIKSIFRRMSFTYQEATSALEKKTIQALGRSVEVKDTYTEGHSARVAFYSVIIANALFLAEDEISIIEDAAYLHDLGKIGIKEEILNKAGPLTDDEWKIMRTHPEKSAIIIESLGFMPDLVPLVKCHHERYDGSGYPENVKGENIPAGARIISVADSFDAITSDRAFRKRRDLECALGELNKNAGSQYDRQIVDIFISEIKKFPGIETLQSYTGAESLELLKLVKR